MRAFADLLEAVLTADAGDTARNLTTLAAVKTALKITGNDQDGLIGDLIPRVTQLIVNHCRLATAVGANPTFALETLRATWHPEAAVCRGEVVFLPWRPPVFSIDTVVENGVTLTAGADFLAEGDRRRLRRMSGGAPFLWSAGQIVATWKAGFSSVLSANVDDALEAAAIEQIKAMLFAAKRDPALLSENLPGLIASTWAVPGGDTIGANVLLPGVRAALAPWRRPSL